MRQFMSLAPSAQYILSAGPLVKSWMQSGLFSTSTSVQLAQHDSSGMLTCGLGLRLQTMRPMMGDMIKPRPWVEKTSETLTPRDLLSEADSAATVAASGYVDAADADAEDEARNHDPDELAGSCTWSRATPNTGQKPPVVLTAPELVLRQESCSSFRLSAVGGGRGPKSRYKYKRRTPSIGLQALINSRHAWAPSENPSHGRARG